MEGTNGNLSDISSSRPSQLPSQVFQSNLYFGSPGSPSDNPFSFVSTSSMTTPSVPVGVASDGSQTQGSVSSGGEGLSQTHTHSSQTDTRTELQPPSDVNLFGGETQVEANSIQTDTNLTGTDAKLIHTDTGSTTVNETGFENEEHSSVTNSSDIVSVTGNTTSASSTFVSSIAPLSIPPVSDSIATYFQAPPTSEATPISQASTAQPALQSNRAPSPNQVIQAPPISSHVSATKPVMQTGLTGLEQERPLDSTHSDQPVPLLTMGVAHPPLVPAPFHSLESSTYEHPQYHHQGSNELAAPVMAPPLPVAPPYSGITNDFVGVAETNAHLIRRRLTNADISQSDEASLDSARIRTSTGNQPFPPSNGVNPSNLPTNEPVPPTQSVSNPHEVDPSCYQSNEAHPPPASPLEGEREITEGDSNPPSASQSLASLLDTGGDQRSALLDSPVQLVPPLFLADDVPVSSVGVAEPTTLSSEDQTPCQSVIHLAPPTSVMDITPPDGEPTLSTVPPPLRSSPPPPPLSSVPPTVSLAYSAVAPPPSVLAGPTSLVSSDPPPLSAFSPPPLNNKPTSTQNDVVPQATPPSEQEPRPSERTPEITRSHSNGEERPRSTRLSPSSGRHDNDSYPHSMYEYDRRYDDRYDHTHYYGDRYNTSYYDDRDYYYRHQQYERDQYRVRDQYRDQYRVRDQWRDHYDDRNRRHHDPRYRWDQRYDHRYDDYYDTRYDWGDQRYGPRDQRYDPRYDARDQRYDSKNQRYDQNYDQRDQHYDQRDQHYDQRDQRYDQRDHEYYYQDGHYANSNYYDERGYPPSSGYPQDTSVIYGHDNIEASYYDGDQPYESTHLEAPPTHGYDMSHQPHLSERYPVGGAYDEEQSQLEAASPSPPQRETPEPFSYPHVCVRFSIGGQLVTTSPVKPTEHSPATVYIHNVQSLVPELNEFSESLEDFPGPLLISDTPKGSVVKYCTARASVDTDPDHSLLWKYLLLLCQQNGVVLPSDVSDLLTQENEANISKSPRGVGVGGAIEEKGSGLDEFRQLLLAGRKKDALNLACSRGLWGHALMLSSRMDDQCRTYVVNRFTASLMTSDPLSTFYTLMLGRLPSVSKPEGLSRAGDWQSHLAMMITNVTPQQDNTCISNLGDSLLSRGRIPAAHLCYHLANVPLGGYGDVDTCKYSLIGIDHTSLMTGSYPSPEQLVRTEVLEYALGLSKADFVLPNFQTFKLVHAFQLIEAGLPKKSLSYCESISFYVIRSPKSFNATFLQLLTDLSIRLHYATCPSGVMESELPSWILTLEQATGDVHTLGTSPVPVISRASPSLSSAGAIAAAMNQSSSLVPPSYATQDYLQVPGGGGGAYSSSLPYPEQITSIEYPPVTEITTLPTTGDNTGQTGYTGYTAPIGYTTDTTDYTPPTGYTAPLGSNTDNVTGYTAPTGYTALTGYAVVPGTGTDQLQPVISSSDIGLEPVNNAVIRESVQEVAQPVSVTGYQLVAASSEVGVSDPYGSSWGSQQPWGQSWNIGTGSGKSVPESQSQTSSSVPVWSQGSTSALISSEPSQVDVTGSRPGFSDYNSTSTLMASSETSSAFPAPPTNQPHPPRTETGEGWDNDENENDLSSKKKEGKNEQADPSANKSWLGRLNPFNLIPKGPPVAHLPDDKNPRIVFDKEKNRWVDLDADEDADSGPAAPPTDSELKSKGPVATSNQYSGMGGARGRLKARYVDVAQSKKSQSAAPPPPALAPPPSLMPASGAQFNQPKFFVPAPPPQGEGSNFESLFNPSTAVTSSASTEGVLEQNTVVANETESLSNGPPMSQEAQTQPSYILPSQQQYQASQVASHLPPSQVPPPHIPPSQAASQPPPSQTPQSMLYPQGAPSQVTHPHYQQQHPQNPAPSMTASHLHPHPPSGSHPPSSLPPSNTQLVQSSRSEKRTESESSDVSIGVPEPQDNTPPQPQFFNPNDFAHMSQRKTAPGQPHHKGRLQQQNDPFPDNVSEASAISELSQEVSQINRQAMGRQRLRPGARPRYQYPSNATASQGQPRPPQAPPPGPPGNWL